MMNINRLPVLCLTKIFDRLPIPDLLGIDEVCQLWADLQPIVTARRIKTLVLHIGVKPTDLIEDSSLVLPHFREILQGDQGEQIDASSSAAITVGELAFKPRPELFINVEKMEIVINRTNPSIVKDIIELIQACQAKLNSLKFRCSFKCFDEDYWYQHSPIYLCQLLEVINRLTNLEYLTVDIRDNLGEYDAQFHLDLPILSRLKEFSFYSYDDVNILFRSLARYAQPNTNLQHISIGNNLDLELSRRFQLGQLANVLQDYHQPENGNARDISSCLTALPNIDLPDNFPELQRFCRTFTSLTTLWINLGELTLSQLTNALSPLHQLMHLNLSTDFVELSRFDETVDEEIHPLPSIKILVLISSTKKHTYMLSRFWGRIFPGVQVIELYHFGAPCIECGQLGVNNVPIDAELRESCMKQLLAPFKQCGELRRIYTTDYFPNNDVGYKREWSMPELGE